MRITKIELRRLISEVAKSSRKHSKEIPGKKRLSRKLNEGPYGSQATGSSLTDLANRIIELEKNFPGALEAALAFDNAPDFEEALNWLSNFDDGGPELEYEGHSTTGDFARWDGSKWSFSSDDDDDDF